MSEDKVFCDICGASAPVDDAVDGGRWIPCFWDERNDCEGGPACPECADTLGIVYDSESGEHVAPEIKQEG